MSSKEKLFASAQKYLEKGQIAKAIKDYEQIVQIDPRDMRHRQKLAELYCRQNMNKEAFASFQTVARSYADAGFYLKSIAVFKQMLKLQPEQFDLYERLAELNDKQGLTGNALGEYRSLALLLEKDKRFDDAAAILQKMKKLDLENVSIRAKIVGFQVKADNAAAARQEFAELLTMLAEKRDSAALQHLQEQFHSLLLQENWLGKDLAQVLLSLGETDQALGLLRELLKRDPSDAEVLEGLADGYRSTANFEQERLICLQLVKVLPATTAFKERYLRACLDGHDFSRAKESFAEWQNDLERECPPEVLQSWRTRLAANSNPSSSVVGEATPKPSIKPIPLTPIAPLLDSDEEEIMDLDLLDELEEVSDELVHDGWDGDSEEIPLAFLETIKSTPFSPIDTPAADLQTSQRTLEIELDVDARFEFGVELELDAELELELESDLDLGELDGEPAVDLDLDNLDPEMAIVDLEESASDSEQPIISDPFHDLLEEANFFLQQEMMVEAEQVCLQLMERAPGYPPAQQLFATISQARRKALPFPTAGSANALAVQTTLREFPVALDTSSATAEFPFAEEELAAEFDFVDLNVPSVDLPSSNGMDLLLEVDAEAAVSQEDSESYFSLGIAYKEMGLLEDAIAEFDKAMLHPARLVDALSLKGICLVETGALEKAEETFQQGLQNPRLGKGEKVCLHYELGLLYEGLGRTAEALEAFQRVADSDQFFRDVQGKLVLLRQILGADETGIKRKTGRDRVSFV